MANSAPPSSSVPVTPAGADLAAATAPDWELIELLFFAYRDFVGDADAALADFGFGRAHHRVLYFVHRNAGLTVADLLKLLRITKQSLARVLKQLVDEGYIESRAGANDRRQRLLAATAKGEALVLRLAHLQTMRIDRALHDRPAEARRMASDFLRAMIGEADGQSSVPRAVHIAEPSERR